MTEQVLRFAKLSALYEHGYLRYIRAGNQEVIRLIYFALRNQDWETPPMKIREEEIEYDSEGFSIGYVGTIVSNEKEIFRWLVKITGRSSGVITFEVNGEALETYQRNRAGLCILHPIRSTFGKPVIVVHPDGRETSSEFPESISPHQPFLDIRSFKWQLNEGVEAQLDFEGDIFETEDQRNWTDASYKTYSTPLSIPFPVTLHRGDKVFQKVTLKITGLEQVEAPQKSSGIIDISLEKSAAVDFLKIGTCHATGQPLPDANTVEKLRRLRFDHLRIELNFGHASWAEILNQGVNEATLLELPIEFALQFDLAPLMEWGAFINHLKGLVPVTVARISLFSTRRRGSPDEFLHLLVPAVRKDFPKVPVGAGSPGYFVDLNRYRFQFDAVDYVTYSLNPQAHAFDNRTMVENTEAQKDTVLYAKQFTGKPVVVSPVTLRSRSAMPEVFPRDADYRQASDFAAGWTLASMKHLAEGGASAITLFESHGMKGFVMAAKDYRHADFEFENESFPVYDLLEMIRNFQPARVLPSSTTSPLELSSLVLLKDREMLVAVANHTEVRLQFRMEHGVYDINSHEIVYVSLSQRAHIA